MAGNSSGIIEQNIEQLLGMEDTESELEDLRKEIESLACELGEQPSAKLTEADRASLQELVARARERQNLRAIVDEFRLQLKAKLIQKLKQTGSTIKQASKETTHEVLVSFQEGSQQLAKDILDSEVVQAFRDNLGQATMAFTTVFRDARTEMLKDLEARAGAFKEKALQEATLKGKSLLENEVTKAFYAELLQGTVETVVAMAKDLAESNKEPLAKLRDKDTYRKAISYLADQAQIHSMPIWHKISQVIAHESKRGFAFGKELITQLADDTKKMIAARREIRNETKKPDKLPAKK